MADNILDSMTHFVLRIENLLVCVPKLLSGAFSVETPVFPQFTHCTRRTFSRSLCLLSDSCSLFFRDSTCSLLRDTSSRKLSSTSLVISNIAALKTVSITPDNWDWNVNITSDILARKRSLPFSFPTVQLYTTKIRYHLAVDYKLTVYITCTHILNSIQEGYRWNIAPAETGPNKLLCLTALNAIFSWGRYGTILQSKKR